MRQSDTRMSREFTSMILRNIIMVVSTLFICCNVSAGTVAGKSDSSIHLGVVSPRGFDNTFKRYQPLANYLSQKIGRKFRVVPLDHPNNMPYLRDGKIDFLLTNPTIAATVYQQSAGDLLLTLNKLSGFQFGGVIFTKVHSGINTLADLKNKRVIAFKIGRSAGGHIFQQYHMLQKGFTEDTHYKWLRSAKTQDFIVKAVENGHADAGYVRTGILEQMANEGKIKISDFVVLDRAKGSTFPEAHTTALYPEWYFIKGNHIDKELSDSVKTALLRIKPNMKVARDVKINGFVDPLPIDSLIHVLKTLRIVPFDK